MENKNQLEEIFWKEGKFVDEKGNPVNPKPIGLPQSIVFNYDSKKVKESERKLKEDVEKKKAIAIKEKPELGYQEANSYSACLHGRNYNPYQSSIASAIQFYRI